MPCHSFSASPAACLPRSLLNWFRFIRVNATPKLRCWFYYYLAIIIHERKNSVVSEQEDEEVKVGEQKLEDVRETRKLQRTIKVNREKILRMPNKSAKDFFYATEFEIFNNSVSVCKSCVMSSLSSYSSSCSQSSSHLIIGTNFAVFCNFLFGWTGTGTTMEECGWI